MIIVGVDEVGRGCLVGNVVAAAVILADDFCPPELTDSKKLSAKKREILYSQITQKCRWAVGQASAGEIDEINILQATMLAMRRAVAALEFEYDRVLVDGNQCPDLENCQAIIKGDLSEPAISAASIIAKVTRDKQMFELDKSYPQYGFSRHKGYGTKQHLAALEKYGLLQKQHRFSFAPVRRIAAKTVIT
ncbi:MAG: ribonuclease HII [Candidatus Thioglobus sp.]|nr:ribonuclease HII [Candidatus Thioglobus sp.]